MKTKSLSILIIVLFSLTLKSQPVISLQQYATGTFTRPVDIANAGDDRLFIVQQRGKIFIVQTNGSTISTPFLDISARVHQTGNEQGLLGLVFHPNYASNGYFYVNYVNGSGNTRISRFHVSSSNPNIADTNELLILAVTQPFSNHNAGDLAFGPDGYLYIPLGDGGDAGDPGNRAQDPLNHLGKILRIDVDSGNPYSIPPSNPYYQFASVLNEIWSRGWRNPWRFSFDRLTGDMWIGDVGQGTREEVSYEPANSTGGGNYGWKCYEGNAAYNTTGCTGTYIPPVYDYDNSSIGCSAVGGFVYRGCQYPDLYGYYVFADYCSGRFWTTLKDSAGNFTTTQKLDLGNSNYCTFGEDVDGELYVAGLSDGKIYKVITQSAGLNISLTKTDESCAPGNDGTVNLSAINGSLPYSYKWSTGATTPNLTGLNEGAYNVTVTDNHDCTETGTVNLIRDVPFNPTVSSNGGAAFCEGLAVTLSTQPGFTSYSWLLNGSPVGINSNSLNADVEGDYSVEVTDVNGCAIESPEFSITVYATPSPAITINGSINICDGDSVELIVGGGIFATLNWSNGESLSSIFVKETGNYDVTVTNINGCEGISSLTSIVVNDLPSVPVITQNNNELTASPQGLSYQWYFEGNLLNGIDSSTITPVQNGNYTVEITDNNGCSSISTLYPFIATGINESPLNGISVQPNPFHENCMITYFLKRKKISPLSFMIFWEKKNGASMKYRQQATIPSLFLKKFLKQVAFIFSRFLTATTLNW